MRGQGASFFEYVTDPSGTPLPNFATTDAVKGIRKTPAWRSDATSGKTDAGERYFSCWNYAIDETVQVWIRFPGKAPQLAMHRLTQKVNAIRITASPQPQTAGTTQVPVTVQGVAFDSLQTNHWLVGRSGSVNSTRA